MIVKVHENNVEKALKALKRRLQKEGIFWEVRRGRYYEKPSVKKRRRQRDAGRRRLKALADRHRPSR